MTAKRQQNTEIDYSEVYPRYHGKLARARSNLNRLLAANIRYSANGKKVVSHATINDRNKFFDKLIRDLHALDYKLVELENLKPKHIQALVSLWERQGLSASSLQKRFSYLRLLCQWLGKPGMIGDPDHYLNDPNRYRREYAARYDKSWQGQDVDQATVIARVEQKDPRVALMLRLIFAFGLRVQEASLFRPQLDDLSDHIQVIAGTKGGRPRVVAIDNDEQRAILEQVRQACITSGRSLIPKTYTLKQWLRHVYYVLEACGVSRQHGIVAHGGRHDYANRLFEELTGEPSAVRGGRGEHLTREQERTARLEVSARLGHAREAVTGAYFGKTMTRQRRRRRARAAGKR